MPWAQRWQAGHLASSGPLKHTPGLWVSRFSPYCESHAGQLAICLVC